MVFNFVNFCSRLRIMKANQMHYFSDLFYEVLYMFRTWPLSIIRLSWHCIQAIGICHASSVGCLLAAANRTTKVGWYVSPPLKEKLNKKRYFNEINKEICLHQLFSKLHNYFSTKPPRTSIHFLQRWSLSVTGLPLRVLSLKSASPTSPSLNRLTQHLNLLTSTHWSP